MKHGRHEGDQDPREGQQQQYPPQGYGQQHPPQGDGQQYPQGYGQQYPHGQPPWPQDDPGAWQQAPEGRQYPPQAQLWDQPQHGQQAGYGQPPWPPQQPGYQPRRHLTRRKSWPARHKELSGLIAFIGLVAIAAAIASALNSPSKPAADTGGGALPVAASGGNPNPESPATASASAGNAAPALPAGFSGQANLTDTEGYTLTLTFSGSLQAPTTDIADDPPGYETISALLDSPSVTITNTTPGRILPDDFSTLDGGIVVGGFWPLHLPCAQGIPPLVTFPEALGGKSCFIEVASFADPGSPGPQQSEELSTTGEPATGAGIYDTDVPTSQESAIISALERGPSLWAIASIDATNEFNARCAPYEGSMEYNVYVLGITPHDASVPQCQATSYSYNLVALTVSGSTRRN